MSSEYAEFIEQSELPDGVLYGRLIALLAMAGPSESIPMRKFRTPHLLLFQRKNPTRVVAPAPHVPDKKWKVIRRFNTSNTEQLDP